MKAEDKIRKAIKVNNLNTAGRIWKGYSAFTLEDGWHFEPTAGQIWFLGRSVADAIDTIQATAEAREMDDYIILPPIHLGSGEEGRLRKRALERLAEEAGHTWNDAPSVGRWLCAIANEKIEEDNMCEDQIYQGNDRVQQVNAIREIAGDIRFGAAGEGTPEELVEYYLSQIDLPEWFDDHDRNLLIQFVSDD